jgi:heptosyltransferase-1
MQILVVKLSSVGDLFHALPTVRALKRGLEAEVDWAVQSDYADVVSAFTDVREVIGIPRRNWAGRTSEALAALRARRYDWILDLQGLLKSAAVAALARGGRRIGPSYHREGARFLYSAVAGPRNKNRHAVDECLDMARFLGVEVGTPEFPVRFPAANRAEPHPRVAVLPSSRWPTKNWPAERFVRTIRLLREKRAVSVFLLGSSADVDLCGRIAGDLGAGVADLAGQLALPRTGGLLGEMDLLIANDSGPVHMAAAVGTPTLVVFGPTEPLRTGPYGVGHRVLSAELPCRPCYSRVCRRGDLACLSLVTPEQVAQAADEMLAVAAATGRRPGSTRG